MPLRLALLLAALLLPGAAAASPAFQEPWPAPTVEGRAVTLASSSPFGLSDVEGAPSASVGATFFLPPGARAEAPVPAVILLHGAGGVLRDRELTYAPQLAQQGIAALVIDTFAARRDLGAGFIDRILNITEVMMLADAYAGLAWLDGQPEIDGARIGLIGFSYGGMASVLAAYRQVAETFLPSGPRFAAHVAYYGPCIVRLEDPETTGAPVLLLSGSGDQLVDQRRCGEIVGDLRSGGSRVTVQVYPGALHQWDGGRGSPWRAGRNLAGCSYFVDRRNDAYDTTAGIPVLNPTARQISLGLCTDTGGYLIGRDDLVRAQSNRALAAFLADALAE